MNDAIEIEKLRQIAKDFRNALDQVTNGFITGAFSKFPKECGADACELLQYFFLNIYKITSDYREGKVQISSRTNQISHCYLVINGFIVDITADQFDKERFSKVIVCDSASYPLTSYFKYVRSRSGQHLQPLNHYLESIYFLVLNKLEKTSSY